MEEVIRQGVLIRVEWHRRIQGGKDWKVSIGLGQTESIDDLGDKVGGVVGVEISQQSVKELGKGWGTEDMQYSLFFKKARLKINK